MMLGKLDIYIPKNEVVPYLIQLLTKIELQKFIFSTKFI